MMVEIIKNFRSRKQNRYKNFDYSSSGAYFVTICTYQKQHLFGRVVQNEVILSDLGAVVRNQIDELQDISNVEVISFIVMPNHIHILVQIIDNETEKTISLSAIVGILKSKVYHNYSKLFAGVKEQQQVYNIWQRSYWDHIVRKQEDMVKIDEYIQRNPEFWSMEKENPETDYPVNEVDKYVGTGLDPVLQDI